MTTTSEATAPVPTVVDLIELHSECEAVCRTPPDRVSGPRSRRYLVGALRHRHAAF